MTRPTILLLLYVVVAAGTCLPSLFIAMKGGRLGKGSIHFIEPLPSNNRRDTHRDTDRWEGFMKCAIEMGSVALT
jgi:hypothetical protein